MLKRRTAVLWAIVAGAAVLGAGAQPWVEATRLTGVPGDAVATTGNQAAAVVPAMALVGMASGVALSMARRAGRIVTALLLVLAGGATVAAALAAVLDPAGAAATQVSAATGTTAAAGAYAVTAWPWVTLAAGAGLALCGLAVLALGRGWRSSRRHDAASRPAAGATAAGAAGAGTGAGTVDEIDAWDELTRGEDPT
ncbi:hypothetical protein E7744_08140 [Citricoccus sp. SGAir0253]|nr:hypothetical protein E7744_08140 [Citricoccus sp. SGAir0253]